MIDLRKKLNKFAVNIKPRDSKETDFHLAVADYLYKELRAHGYDAMKKDVIVKVSLANKYEDKYEQVLIDCLEGKIYLRGKALEDRYLSRFRKFEGQRVGEAYSCVIENVKAIIDKIESLSIKLDNVVLGEVEIIDMRRSITRIDMRKKLEIARIDMRKIARTDLRKKTASAERKDLRKIAGKIIDMRLKKN